MKVDLDQYRVHIPLITKMSDNNKQKSALEIVRMYVGPGSPPLIVIAYYMLEIRGEDDELRKFIEMLVKFYGYSTISGL